jgi:APA family basic amino acid/polyamine antiporter
VIKSAVLVIFVVAGIAYVQRENLTPFVPPNTGEFGAFGWSGVLRGAAIIFFAYIGFDAVSTAAQEARRPQRDLPIGILASLAICTVLYIAVAVVLIGIVPYGELDVPDPLAVGIDRTGMTWLSPVIKVSALFGLFSTMLVQLLGQSRIFFAMSRDRLLPDVFGSVHPRFRTPHLSTMIIGAVVALGAGLLPLSVLSELVSMGTLLAFVLVCLGILVLRRSAPDLPRPFRTPGYPWVPLLGIASCVLQMLVLPGTTWLRLTVWLVAGLVIYFAYGRRRTAALARRRAEGIAEPIGDAAS